jgi:glycosyltransferase involved in cell wall biosynthesis
MPYIVLEAIAAGIPVVATRVGGSPEIFGPYSERLVGPGDAAALADAMAAITAGPNAAQTTAAALKARVRSQFSVESMALAIEEIYRAVVAVH